MNLEQFETLKQLRRAPDRGLLVTDLVNQKPRTLVWGYTLDRDSFHVYLDPDDVIHKVVYNLDGVVSYKASPMPSECLPNKRAYPEACDFEFAQLLKLQYGMDLCFTTFNPERLDAQFHGKRLLECV